jgi:Xaa-Pro aminopeptidase
MAAMADRLASRRSHALAAVVDHGADGLLVTGAVNIRYLSGFDGSAGALLLTADASVLATDGRYQEQAAEQVGDVAVELTRDYADHLVSLAPRLGVARLGIEADHVTWADGERLRAHAHDVRPSAVPLVPTTSLIETLRMTKDAGEIDTIRDACRITDEALLHVVSCVRAGVSERELAAVFLDAIRDAGADGPSFDPIVAFAENTAQPHHRPGDRRLHHGEVVLLDVGAQVDGYCADLSRTVALGVPDPRMVEIHNVVAAAQTAGVAAVHAGVEAQQVDAAARDAVTEAGFAERFVHGTGHGLGLEIHEAPLIGPAAIGRLGPSFTVTVEPGVYLPGVGGVRIEDTVLVTDSGAEHLTTVPRALIEC